MNSENEKKVGQQRYILILLIVVCIAPVVGSWWLVNFAGFGEARGRVNHGSLIQPPRPLPNMSLFNPTLGTDDASLHGKWSLIYLLEDGCDEACEQNLYKMRQLEAATGKHSHRVQRVLVTYGQNRDLLSAELSKLYERQLIAIANQESLELKSFSLTEGDAPLKAGRLYVVDPLGNLMMSYIPEAEPSGIIRDLKRLLKYSKIG